MNTSEVRAADSTWTASKIRTLVQGEATVTVTDATGRSYDEHREGPTAYELRCRAEDTGNVDMILDVIQLDRAIDTIMDDGVFFALLQVVEDGADVDDIVDITGRGRAGYLLVERGVELIRRHEGARRAEKARLDGDLDEPVCFRCQKRRVREPGDLCREDCDGLSRAQRRRRRGLVRGTSPQNAPYDPTKQPSPKQMSQAEIDAEIALLAATQDRAPIAGDGNYRSMVSPVGLEPRLDLHLG